MGWVVLAGRLSGRVEGVAGRVSLLLPGVGLVELLFPGVGLVALSGVAGRLVFPGCGRVSFAGRVAGRASLVLVLAGRVFAGTA